MLYTSIRRCWRGRFGGSCDAAPEASSTYRAVALALTVRSGLKRLGSNRRTRGITCKVKAGARTTS